MKSEKEIYLAGGCFWGAEHFLKQISGVTYTAVGFANGNVPDPTYSWSIPTLLAMPRRCT